MAQTIIEKGHEVNIFNQEKRLGIHLNIAMRCECIFFNCFFLNVFFRTPLHMAMGTFSEPMIRLLLSYGARIDAEDSQSKRPMDYVNEGMSGDILYEITSSVVADSEIRDAIQRDDDADRATLQSVGKTARMGLIADPSHEQLNPLAPSTSGDSSLFKLAESRPYFVGLNDQNRQKASTTNIAAPSSYSGHHHSEETSGLNVTSIIQTGDEASSDAEVVILEKKAICFNAYVLLFLIYRAPLTCLNQSMKQVKCTRKIKIKWKKSMMIKLRMMMMTLKMRKLYLVQLPQTQIFLMRHNLRQE